MAAPLLVAAVPALAERFGSEPRVQLAEGGRQGATVAARAQLILSQSRKGRSWVTPRGVTRWPIMVQSQQRGTLWEDVDLAGVTLGDHWQTGWGVRVELMHGGRVVGMLWVEDE